MRNARRRCRCRCRINRLLVLLTGRVLKGPETEQGGFTNITAASVCIMYNMLKVGQCVYNIGLRIKSTIDAYYD